MTDAPMTSDMLLQRIESHFASLQAGEPAGVGQPLSEVRGQLLRSFQWYRKGIENYLRWARSPNALPTDEWVVMHYLQECAQNGEAISTLRHRLYAIAFVHRVLGHSDPTRESLVKEALAGLEAKAKCEKREPRHITPLNIEQIRQLLDAIGNELVDLRDKALILTGFFGGLRQLDLQQIAVEDLVVSEGQYLIAMEKGDRSAGYRAPPKRVLPLLPGSPYCPVAALDEWLVRSGISSGPIFRAINRHGQLSRRGLSHTAMNNIVKNRARAANLAHPESVSTATLRASHRYTLPYLARKESG